MVFHFSTVDQGRDVEQITTAEVVGIRVEGDLGDLGRGRSRLWNILHGCLWLRDHAHGRFLLEAGWHPAEGACMLSRAALGDGTQELVEASLGAC